MSRNKKTHRAGRTAVGSVLLAVLSGMAHGCKQEDADCLARIGQKTLARADSLTGAANGRLVAGWQALRGETEDTSVAGRVLARLRWDRELDGVQIAVQTVPGKVELRGKVRSAEQRQRAVELTQTTVGVEDVADLLEVGEAAP